MDEAAKIAEAEAVQIDMVENEAAKVVEGDVKVVEAVAMAVASSPDPDSAGQEGATAATAPPADVPYPTAAPGAGLPYPDSGPGLPVPSQAAPASNALVEDGVVSDVKLAPGVPVPVPVPTLTPADAKIAGPGTLDADAKPAAVAVAVAGTVLAERPAVVSEAEILAGYQTAGFDMSTLPVAEAVEAPPEGHFFSDAELAVLDAQPVPAAVDYDAVGNAAPPPPANAAPPPGVVLQPGFGGMPVMPNAFSTARFSRDSMKSGIRSRDPALDSKEEVLKFLNQHNSRPIMLLNVHGYHTESHTVSDGKGGTKSESRTVTDFRYDIDLTPFIYPFGKITVDAAKSDTSVEELIEEFLQDTNALRSLQMKKKVFWDTRGLEGLVYGYVRQCWHRGLTVSAHTLNKSVRICDDNNCAKIWDNCCGRCLMITTIIPALVFAIYGSGHRERGLRSIFVIQASPLQVFDTIRPQIMLPNPYPGGNCTIS